MLARPELLLPLAFALSGLMIVAALVLLRLSMRQSKQAYRVAAPHSGVRVEVPPRSEATRQMPARKRRARIYA